MKRLPIIFTGLIGLFFLFSFAETEKKDLDTKTQHCQEILAELAAAKGLSKNQVPDIEVVETLSDSRVAIGMFEKEPKWKISLHEWTYDICFKKLGKDSLNGLAFIIAHELSHQVNNHTVRQLYFKESNVSQNAGFVQLTSEHVADSTELDRVIRQYNTVSERFRIRKNEAEADLEAGFMAYLAGYDTKEAGAEFLKTAYRVFEIDTHDGLYVSLDERSEIIRRTGMKLDTLIAVFEGANNLAVIGEHDFAAHCYAYVAKFFESKSILNNIGLMKILAVSKGLSPEEVKYELPVTLETQMIERFKNFIPEPDTTGETSAIISIDNTESYRLIVKLDEAIAYLNKALLLDPSYHVARINLAVAQYLHFCARETDMMGYPDTEDWLFYSEAELRKLKNSLELDHTDKSKKYLSDVWGLMAVLKQVQKDTITADSLLNISLNLNPENRVSQQNKIIFDQDETENEALDSGGQKAISLCDQRELIHGHLTFDQYLEDSISNYDLSLSVWKEKSNLFSLDTFYLDFKETDAGKWYELSILNFSVKERFRFFQTNNNYTKSTACGFTKEMKTSKINARYGLRPELLQKSNGSSLMYKQSPFEDDENNVVFTDGIIFNLDLKGQVAHWTIFESMTMKNK